MNWSEITALLGGTFDPPHLGHREAAESLLSHPGVKEVLVLPSAMPPHKAGRTPPEHRLEMCRLNFSGNPRIQVSDYELQQAIKKGTPNYSFETLRELAPRYEGRLAFVIGTDQLRDLPTWKNFPHVLGLSHWIVVGRRPDGVEKAKELLQGYSAQGLFKSIGDSQTWQVAGSQKQVIAVPTAARPMSSSEIRAAIAKGGSPAASALHPQVEAYLMLRGLYGTEGKPK